MNLQNNILMFLFIAFTFEWENLTAPECTRSCTRGRAPLFNCSLILSEKKDESKNFKRTQLEWDLKGVAKGLLQVTEMQHELKPEQTLRNCDHYK